MIKFINPRIKVIISMVIWGTIGIFIRGISLSGIEFAFFRAFIASVFLILMSLINKNKINKEILKANLLLLCMSGVALGLNWVLLFQAIKYTTVANATISYCFAPMFVIFFSVIFFKEEISIKNIMCLFGAIFGLFLIVNSGEVSNANGFNHAKGILYGLGGAIFYATVTILNKYVKGLPSFQATLIQLIMSVIVLSPVVFYKNSINFQAIDLRTWIFILIVGIVHTGIAYVLYLSSVNDIKSQSIAILSYLDPLVAILVSFVLLGEPMSTMQTMGVLLILVTAYINERPPSYQVKYK